jgi:hypothetical protein
VRLFLRHPWAADWVAVGAFWLGIFLFGFRDSPLHSDHVAVTVVPPALVILSASLVRRAWVSCQRSRIGFWMKVGLPILLYCAGTIFAVGLFTDASKQDRLRADQGVVDDLGPTIHADRHEYGRLAPDDATVEARGQPGSARRSCAGQGGRYDAVSGSPILAVTDHRAC